MQLLAIYVLIWYNNVEIWRMNGYYAIPYFSTSLVRRYENIISRCGDTASRRCYLCVRLCGADYGKCK